MHTPSREMPAVRLAADAGDPGPGEIEPDETDLGEVEPDPGAPDWAREILRLLREHGARLDRIESDLRRQSADIRILGNAYRVQAQELTLIRRNCPGCVEDRTSGDGADLRPEVPDPLRR